MNPEEPVSGQQVNQKVNGDGEAADQAEESRYTGDILTENEQDRRVETLVKSTDILISGLIMTVFAVIANTIVYYLFLLFFGLPIQARGEDYYRDTDIVLVSPLLINTFFASVGYILLRLAAHRAARPRFMFCGGILIATFMAVFYISSLDLLRTAKVVLFVMVGVVGVLAAEFLGYPKLKKERAVNPHPSKEIRLRRERQGDKGAPPL